MTTVQIIAAVVIVWVLISLPIGFFAGRAIDLNDPDD